MEILVQATQRHQWENNRRVWEEAQKRGHQLLFWVIPRKTLDNEGWVQDIQREGYEVMESGGPDFLSPGEWKVVEKKITFFSPRVVFPLKLATGEWKGVCRKMDWRKEGVSILTIQDALSPIRGVVSKERFPPNSSFPWFAVWGEYFREKLLRSGFPGSRIVITGNPLWDQLPPPHPISPPIVLFLGGDGFDFLEDLWMVKVLREFPSIRFFFRDHPVHPGFFSQALHGLDQDPRVWICNRENASRLISSASVVVASTTTCSIEAMIQGIPTIIIDNGRVTEKFIPSGRVIPRSHYVFEGELKRCLERKEDRGVIPKFLSRVAGSLDGRASQGVVDLIERIAN